MPFNTNPGEILHIDGEDFRVTEHPNAIGMPAVRRKCAPSSSSATQITNGVFEWAMQPWRAPPQGPGLPVMSESSPTP